MTAKDVALEVYRICKKSIENDPVISTMPEESRLDVLECNDGTYQVYLGTHTIVYCDGPSQVTIGNNPNGQYDDYGEVPVLTPVTDETIGYAMLYLVNMRTIAERTRLKKKSPAYVDITQLMPPNPMIS